MTAYYLDSIMVRTTIQNSLTKLYLILLEIRADKSGILTEAKLHSSVFQGPANSEAARVFPIGTEMYNADVYTRTCG